MTVRTEAPHLNVTTLSQYIRLDNCERYIRLRLRRDEERALLDRWQLTIQPLTPLLKESGYAFEHRIAEKIAQRGEPVIDLKGEDVEATAAALQQVGRSPAILLQPRLQAPLGRYLAVGDADVIRLQKTSRGRLRVMIADIKASRHERTEHRLQVATYAYLLRLIAEEIGLEIQEMHGAVLHLSEGGSLPTLDLETPTFEMETYFDILERLAIAPDCLVNRVAAARFHDVPYHLSYKCDGCQYNAICMYDTAERLDLSLVPHISAVEKRVLRDAGIHTLPELAALMDLPPRGSSELTPTPGKEDLVNSLENEWPVGPNLPVLVQRARRAMRRFDPSVVGLGYILNGSFGALPADEEHPDLVKLFFDAQHDYLQDRVYMITALVKGPKGERPVLTITNGPPTEESEQDLLIQWVTDVIRAMRSVAQSNRAPVHLYGYNRYDQQVLLDALKRHLDAVAALPGFFDLMTQSPALSQPIISSLFDELKERTNVGLVCTPLHDAARMRGFDWEDERHQYYRLFRAKLFDNRHNVVRQPDGTLVRAGRDMPRGASSRLTIEAAARFNSQIPLEYAYAVWDVLPEGTEDDALLEPYRRVSRDQLIGFAVHRTRALAHIEDSFQYKARFIDKPPVSLPALAGDAKDDFELVEGLREFVYMEHHSSLQSKLMIYAYPIERRVMSGLSLLLRYERQDPDGYRFAIEFEELRLDPVLTMNACRLKEGDWLVLNSANPAPSAARIKNGRLAIIQAIDDGKIVLDLLPLTFYRSSFRYPHDKTLEPEAGQLYTLDQMADDLNADKIIDALANIDTNVFYSWLIQKSPPRQVSQEAEQAMSRFSNLVDQLDGRKRPTARQREVIVERLADPLFLVQGPPGTGKSHTVAWAVLARMAVAAAENRPFRVAVSCKTHNATNIVLREIATKHRLITGTPLPLVAPLRDLGVYKLVNDLNDEVPPYVQPFCAYEQRRELEALLDQRFLVVGGTPGGHYSMQKYRPGRRGVDFSLKTFDLVVMDEASQMSLPEGVLVTSFLKPAGQAIVVGDHRQMPPIVAHPWDDEEKRSIAATRPYLSLFESFVAREFPRIGLDESFRLHTRIADFLQDNIYVRDGIQFFSRREHLLTQPPPTGPFVDTVLAPEYPIVVIEHTEQRSQQYNETELGLVKPLIEVCAHKLRLNGIEGIGVVVPHRAQKAVLRAQFPDLAVTDSIDTVERFQGGERDVIIVSATASDPDYVLAEADFLLDLNRLNVALSRPRMKLVVVASRSVVELLTSDLDIFENAVIWKRLYYQYAGEVLWQGRFDGVDVTVRGRHA